MLFGGGEGGVGGFGVSGVEGGVGFGGGRSWVWREEGGGGVGRLLYKK